MIAGGTALGAIVVAALWIWSTPGERGPSGGFEPFCWPAGLATVPSEPRGRVNWMGHWLGEDKRESLVREVAAEFGFLHQGIEVNLKFPQEIMGSRGHLETARFVAAMIRSGRVEWDVLWLEPRTYEYVAEELSDPDWGAKHLVDFREIPGFAETQKPFIIADPAYRNQTGGILTGPYIEGYYYALWYNQDVARRLGLTIKPAGMTFEDLLGYVRAVAEYNRNHKEGVAAFYESSDWVTMEILFQRLVKSLLSFEEGKREESSPEKLAALRRTLAAFEALGRYDPLIASHGENQWFATRGLVLNDAALFYVNGTWMYSHWRGMNPEKMKKMAPVELPAFGETDHYLGGYLPTWAVMKATANREHAIDLVMFWSRPAIAEKWVRYTKNPTGLRGHLASPAWSSDVFERFVEDVGRRYVSRVDYSSTAGYLLGRENWGLQREIEAELILILTGETSAEEAYDRIMALCR